MNTDSLRSFAALCLAIGSYSALGAVDAGPVSFHGSVSATAASSDTYSYHSKTEGTVDVSVLELILNGSHRFDNGLRATAQLYAYDLGGYSDLAIDFATLDYSFNEAVGLRVGRVKRPLGLYGDSQDIDIVRPFAFLPLDLYPKGLRALLAGIDGASVYGNVGMGRAGAFEYQVAGGWMPPTDTSAPYLQGVSESNLFVVDSVNNAKTVAVSAFWATPVTGLRVGYSFTETSDLTLSGAMKTAAQMALASSNARFAPLQVGSAWDTVIAGRKGSQLGTSTRHIFSAEYTRGDWQFAVEYMESIGDFDITTPLGKSHTKSTGESYYAMVTWQANDRLQLGSYYAEGFANKDDHDGNTLKAVPKHLAWQKDFTLAASYAITNWWMVKGEVHVIDGTRGLTTALNGDAAKWSDSRWNYYVIKSTISF